MDKNKTTKHLQQNSTMVMVTVFLFFSLFQITTTDKLLSYIKDIPFRRQ